MIKFNKHNVKDTETGKTSRVHYSMDNRIDGRPCVTIYAKDYDNHLAAMFDTYRNETDMMTDYFEKGNVDLFEDHPQYKEARKRAEAVEAKYKARREAYA